LEAFRGWVERLIAACDLSRMTSKIPETLDVQIERLVRQHLVAHQLAAKAGDRARVRTYGEGDVCAGATSGGLRQPTARCSCDELGLPWGQSPTRIEIAALSSFDNASSVEPRLAQR
jgi:hypothetical protein